MWEAFGPPKNRKVYVGATTSAITTDTTHATATDFGRLRLSIWAVFVASFVNT